MDEIAAETQCTPLQQILQRLQQEEFEPEIAQENLIRLRIEGRTVWIETDRDPALFRVKGVLGPMQADADLRYAQKACDTVKQKTLANAYLLRDKRKAVVEMAGYFADIQQFLETVVCSIELTRAALRTLEDRMRELRIGASA